MKELLISSSILIIVIFLLRTILGKYIGHRAQYALWLLVLIRLLLPISLPESSASVMNYFPDARPANPKQDQALIQAADFSLPPFEKEEGQTPIPAAADTAPKSSFRPSATVLLRIAWAAGAFCMGIWIIVTNLLFYQKLRLHRRKLEYPDCTLPVYQYDDLPSPCLFGLFRPAIYLNRNAAKDPTALSYAIRHEMQHYKHLDHIWGLFRCLCLTVYWFDPFIYPAAIFSRRDCELACDEGVIRELNPQQRLEYGRCLLAMTPTRAAGLKPIAATTMSSGARQMKKRLAAIVKKPKTALWAIALTLILAFVITGCTFTGAKQADEDTSPIQEADDSRDISPSQAPDHTEISEKDTLSDILDAFQKSIRVTNGNLVFTIPQSRLSGSAWNIFISGRSPMGDDWMSVHYLEEEQYDQKWAAGTEYIIAPADQAAACTELFMDVSLTDGDDSLSVEVDLLAVPGLSENTGHLNASFLPEEETLFVHYSLTDDYTIAYGNINPQPPAENETWLKGHIYLLHKDEVTVLNQNDESAEFFPIMPIRIGERVLFGWETLWGSTTTTTLYTLEYDRLIQIPNTGEALEYLEDGQFTTSCSAYDSSKYNSDDFMTGHTWKRYWLYWDEDSLSLREYGGIEITSEELLQIPASNRELVQDTLTAITDGGYYLDTIYLRGNGIININYHSAAEYDNDLSYEYHNASLQLSDGTFTMICFQPNEEDLLSVMDQGGIYGSAAFPDFADFPELSDFLN